MYLNLIYILLLVKLAFNFENYINNISKNYTGQFSYTSINTIRLNMINLSCFYVFVESGDIFLINFKENKSMIKYNFSIPIFSTHYSSYLYKLYNNNYIFVGDNETNIFLLYENGTQIKNFSIPSISEYYLSPIHVSKTNNNNWILLTYLNKYFKGILHFINIKNYKQKLFHTNLRWMKNDINYQCEYFNLIENYICIYSNNNITLLLELYTIYGRINNTFPIMNITRPSFGKTYFLIFENNDDKFNIKSDIIIVTKVSSTLYIIDLEIELVFPKIFKYNIKNMIELRESRNINFLKKISNTTFLITMGNYIYYFYDISLNYLGNQNHNSLDLKESIIYYFDLIPYNNYKNFFLIYAESEQTNKTDYYFHLYNFTQITCKNISINVNSKEGISFYLNNLINTFDNFDIFIKFFPLENKEYGYLEYNFINNDNSNGNKSDNYEIDFDEFYTENYYFIYNNLLNNISFNIKYILIQNIENIYFPGEPCNIKIN